ncbi:hypothetical protein ES332_A07G215800v1 [Gossypium tomentosum]|uniref:Cell differentiation protein rcd1 n=1 Tax=Gossypium tomentosum TaxID=34277 RepID=A0A5D2PY25_GOSTO|nr:hypothetical protein ES332_A07G215800v1 [Gossypium tomentosum]
MVRKAAYPPSFRPIRNPCINLLQIYRLVRQLRSLEIGEQCLDLLSKNRHSCNLLAIFLWSSPGSMRLLLLVITSAYRPLVSNRLSERVTLASHPHTKMSFIRASMPEYLYAFLKTRSRERNYERLRFASLVVIGSLVEVDNPEVVDYLLATEMFPCCLCCMEIGTTLSKTVATFIIYRILLNEKGLNYLLSMPERYLVVTHCLENMVEILDVEDEEYLPHLLKNIICCYLRISENEKLANSNYHLCFQKEKAHANFLFQGDPEALCNLRRLIWLFGSGTGIQENLPVSHLDWSSDYEECNLLRTEIEKPKMAKKEVRKREIPERRGRV